MNPQLQVPLTYPEATTDCFAGPRGDFELPLTDGADELPLTGTDAAMLPIALAGGLAATIGLVFLILQRRRHT